MIKVIFALIQTMIAIALFCSYYLLDDIGSLIIACMLLICVKISHVESKL